MDTINLLLDEHNRKKSQLLSQLESDGAIDVRVVNDLATCYLQTATLLLTVSQTLLDKPSIQATTSQLNDLATSTSVNETHARSNVDVSDSASAIPKELDQTQDNEDDTAIVAPKKPSRWSQKNASENNFLFFDVSEPNEPLAKEAIHDDE